jgi:squalene-hopene/tetraprenyl-beta-curcumene cyclase
MGAAPRIVNVQMTVIAAVTIFSTWPAGGLLAAESEPATRSPSWDARAAAAYLDSRQAWWMTWPGAARDHDTQCVACHTVLPYALARPALRGALAEHEASAPERKMLEHVAKRVRLWGEVQPFYPDQTSGLRKTSESRGTEAILNAVILATRDANTGTLSDDARLAFDNLWALQLKAGEMAGAWAWLDFHNEPWEAPGSQYFGNALAAIAIGNAPGGYASTPGIQDRVTLLATYLRGGAQKEHLLNRTMILWASTRISGVLTTEQRQRIVDDLVNQQRADGGWSTASLVGEWKRHDSTPMDPRSDGCATGLITYVLQQAGRSRADPEVARGLTWLAQHQDPASGMWIATSVNKRRDPASDVGKFMSDAAPAYAVMALTRP